MLICDSVGLALCVKLSVFTVYLCGGFVSLILSAVWFMSALCVSITVSVVSAPDIIFLTGIMFSPFQF